METIALILLIAGVLLCINNIYASWLRFPIHKYLKKRPDEEFVFVSGIPLFGSLFVVIALLLSSVNVYVYWFSVLLALLDTGGIHWYLVTVLYSTSNEKNT
ncbi:hypothetical protein [Pleionea sediminis]|uniref:hypothetical protein n=1 Tax=Pleionea sediminis TaxID=2569479 RepID=UPI001186345E|nr:hypothetical protein [Pleionea sediminis]